MAFLATANTSSSSSKQRFSLLVLEPGELYFNDYSVFFHPDASADSNALDSENAMKRKIRGRLKLCSNSLVFDPQDITEPMLKFPFRDCKQVAEMIDSQLRTREDVFMIVCDKIFEMLESGTIAPYKIRKEHRAYKFSLNFVQLKDVLPRIEMLMKIHRMRPSERELALSNIVRDIQKNTSFDPSWLVDLYEKRLLEYSGVRVTPLVANHGQIVLTNSRLYFQPYNNVDPDPVAVFPLNLITRIVKRRYLQRQVGLEIFLKPANTLGAKKNTQSQVFFSFHDRVERDTMYNIIMQQEALTSLEEEDTQNYTLRWQNGLISNYDYLLYLNSMADRTINDLTQYPVFPWVLQDYTSPTLDLNDPAVYRDLSKPIGALDPDRLSMFQQRYKEMPDPKFLYGTHYSTPGYVLYYLVRTAPQYMLCLQNGRFDTPDRLFYSIPATWNNVLHNPTDVKELIPEFYTLPDENDSDNPSDFLANSLGLHLGVRQNQKKVNDVELPPWAKDSGDFLKKHREALESPYVSKRLHEWIDLIFGYKQRGDAALAANNVFYYLTYEGAVDLDAITDPGERAALELQINEFGQTPKQLFKVPHPRRVATTQIDQVIPLPISPAPKTKPLSTAATSETQKSSLSLPPSLSKNDEDDSEPAIKVLPDDIVALVSSHLSVSNDSNTSSTFSSAPAPLGLISPSPVPSGGTGQWSQIEKLQCAYTYKIHQKAVSDICLAPDAKTVYSVSQDASLKIYCLNQKKQLRAINISELALSSCSLSEDGKSIFVSSWDNNIYVYSIAYGRILDTIVGHHDAVGCIRLRETMLLSVSWDSTMKVWDCPMSTGSNKKSRNIAEFSEHETEIKCVDISPCGKYAVTGGADGVVILWNLEMDNIGMLNSSQVHAEAVNAVQFAPNSQTIITCGEDGFAKILGLNMQEIMIINAEEPLKCVLADAQFLICGSEQGNIRVWESVSGKEIATFAAYNCPVTCLKANKDGQTIMSGGEDGTIKQWEIPK